MAQNTLPWALIRRSGFSRERSCCRLISSVYPGIFAAKAAPEFAFTNKNPPGMPGDFQGAMSQSDHGFTSQLTIRPEHPANTTHGLTNPVLVFDQGETHVIVAASTYSGLKL
ncbi:Uncharacterised protein [Paucimonas lemoignei]|nr:Uncharacterised protein [Paucimonas lemoignei]